MTMTRISSYNQFYGNTAGITTGQANMAKAQAQASTEKVATDLKGYAQDSGRLLSAKTYADRLERRAESLLALQARAEVEATAMSSAVDAAKQVRDAIGTAVANNNGAGFRAALEQALGSISGAANIQYNGQAIFGGTWGYGDPFTSPSLDAMAIAGAGAAGTYWVDTGENRTVMLEDDRQIQLSPGAEEIFRPIVDFLREVRTWENANAPIAGSLTTAQSTYLRSIMPQIAAVQSDLIDYESSAGITAKKIEESALTLTAKRDTLTKVIGDQENVNLAEVATRLAAAQNQYQASAAIFGQMRDMNLLQYLR
jgi:flagellar hook-associated protein 3 FlgL